MIVSPLSAPDYESIIPLSLVAEFVGYDGDLDINQDKVLPALRAAAVQHGEQITGIVWAATEYRISGSLPIFGPLRPPVAPVLSVESLTVSDADGNETSIANFTLTPSAIELGRPYACLEWPEVAKSVAFAAKCTAGWGADTFPSCLQSWALNRIAALYDYREDIASGGVHGLMPRDHSRGLLDRYTVRVKPHA